MKLTITGENKLVKKLNGFLRRADRNRRLPNVRGPVELPRCPHLR